MTTNLLNFDPANAVVKISSREISIVTDKEHKHVLRDIRVMAVDLYAKDLPSEREGRSRFINDNLPTLFDGLKNAGPNLDHPDHSAGIEVVQDQRGNTAEILLDRAHAINLVSGYSARLRMAVIRRLEELEAERNKPTLPVLSSEELIAAIANNAAKQARELAETKALVVAQDARIESLEARSEPIRAPQAILTGGQEIKSQAKRRMSAAHGISLAVCDDVFDYYWNQLRTGLSVVNPTDTARTVTPYCDVFYKKTVNDIFNRVLAEATPVGKQYKHKAIPGLFRIKPRAE